MPYKAVCFDIDGTLYPKSLMNCRLVRLYLRHPVFVNAYMKNRKAFRRYQDSFKKDIPLFWREAMIIQNKSGKEPETAFNEETYRKTYDKLQKFFYEPMKKMYEKTPLYDGVKETLTKLKSKGIRVGLLSDFPLFDNKLKGLGIEELVDFAISSDDIGFLKPSVHCMDKLLYNLNMDRTEVLYVGDSYDKDILGSKNANMDGVLVNSKKSQDQAPLAKAVFSNWKDFDSWLMANVEEY